MAELPSQHGSDGGASSTPNFLTAAFPSRQGYQKMDDVGDAEGGPFGMTSLGPHSPGMDIEMAPTPSERQSPTIATIDFRPVSPMELQGTERAPLSPMAAAVPEASSAPGAIASPTPRNPRARVSKFTEVLRRTLSSSWANTDLSSAYRDGNLDYSDSVPLTSSRAMHETNQLHSIPEYDNMGTRDDADTFSLRYTQAPLDCHSRRDVHVRRTSWLYITLIILSIYSSLVSGLLFVVSILQPRYGKFISSGAGHSISPSTASTLAMLIAKTTELAFVTIFTAFVGQVLTRRAFVAKSEGITISEMTMRSWVTQPGSLFTRWQDVPYAGTTLLGLLTLMAALSTTLYTTASDALVTPKLIFGNWEYRELQGRVRASYANPFFVQDTCTTPINTTMDPNAPESCLDVYYSGQSYQNLLAFMDTWQQFSVNGTSASTNITERPVSTSLLYGNTTMYSSWIEGEFGDPAAQFQTHERIVNNVTMSVPHPGVYAAATDSINEILQPSDLSGVGEYQIRASVASPTVNTMCINMNKSELAPLVYTTWPNANNTSTDIPGQEIGWDLWYTEVPAFADDVWLNSTVVDDLFLWGEKYGRRPPVFQLYPSDYNMITNTTVWKGDSIYFLSKSPAIANYTLCQLRSWMTPKCSTQFNISGISGAEMIARCEDPNDADQYDRSVPNLPTVPSVDWKYMVDEWRLSMDLNGGVTNNDASNARILTNLILQSATLPPLLPSMAEALSVLAGSTLVIGSMQSSYRQYWDSSYPSQELAAPGVYESFKSSLRTQQYASSHTSNWQGVFYPVLAFVFLLSLFCLVYFTLVHGMVTDYTEPQNMFALAVNSPPSYQLQGSCGGGPADRELVVPWRVGYAESSNHYFFEEANDKPWRGRFSKAPTNVSGADTLAGGVYKNSYNRLSRSRHFL
ncbi:hypothetical protein BX600DRAFT_458597 [Xylariales sp. PMI_506]|nr:hypothetical protein BX600DRAFT_458597 [Xylariales sp. PMI_506]